MKRLTKDEALIRILAGSGQIQHYKNGIDWGAISLYCAIAGISAFVGFVGAFLIIAFLGG